MENISVNLHGKLDIRLDEIALQPLDKNQVRVRVRAGGICGSDLHYYFDGGFGQIRVREPIILGHEAAGEVVETGAAVTAVHEGDLIAINPSMPCHNCENCKNSATQHCTQSRFMGSARMLPHERGAFSRFVEIGESQCHVFKGDVSLAEAACTEPLAVCLHAVKQAPDLAGKRVLITGAGPIGMLCASLAAHYKAEAIVITDISDFPLGVAPDVGATDTINVKQGTSELDDFVAKNGAFDVVFECSAAESAIEAAFKSLKVRGTLVQVGVSGQRAIPLDLLVAKEINFVGSFRFHDEFDAALRLIETRQIDVRKIITNQFDIEDADAAFLEARDREKAIKVQFKF